jgi:hypothetical protein
LPTPIGNVSVSVQGKGAFTQSDVSLQLVDPNFGGVIVGGVVSPVVRVVFDDARLLLEGMQIALPIQGGFVPPNLFVYFRPTGTGTWAAILSPTVLDELGRVVVSKASPGEWMVATSKDAALGSSGRFGFAEFALPTQLAPTPAVPDPTGGQPFGWFVQDLVQRPTPKVSALGPIPKNYPMCISNLYLNQTGFEFLADTSGSSDSIASEIQLAAERHRIRTQSGGTGLFTPSETSDSYDSFTFGAFGKSALRSSIQDAINSLSDDHMRLRVLTIAGDGQVDDSDLELQVLAQTAKASGVQINYLFLRPNSAAVASPSDGLTRLVSETGGQFVRGSGGASGVDIVLDRYLDSYNDPDEDSLTSCEEQTGVRVLNDSSNNFETVITDPTQADVDSDHLTDELELQIGSDPRIVTESIRLARTVRRLVSHPRSADSDGDLLTDNYERANDLQALKKNNPLDAFEFISPAAFSSLGVSEQQLEEYLDYQDAWDPEVYGRGVRDNEFFGKASASGKFGYLWQVSINTILAYDAAANSGAPDTGLITSSAEAIRQLDRDSNKQYAKIFLNFQPQYLNGPIRNTLVDGNWIKYFSPVGKSHSEIYRGLKEPGRLNEIIAVFDIARLVKLQSKVNQVLSSTIDAILQGVLFGLFTGFVGSIVADATVSTAIVSSSLITLAARVGLFAANLGLAAGQMYCAIRQKKTYDLAQQGLTSVSKRSVCPADVVKRIGEAQTVLAWVTVLDSFNSAKLAQTINPTRRPYRFDAQGISNVTRTAGGKGIILDGYPVQERVLPDGSLIDVPTLSRTSPPTEQLGDPRPNTALAEPVIDITVDPPVGELAPKVARQTESRLVEIVKTCFGGQSFGAATKVLMGDGSLKQISKIGIGDRVTSENPATGIHTVETVVATYPHTDFAYELRTADGTIFVTPDHPTWDPATQSFRPISEIASVNAESLDGKSERLHLNFDWTTGRNRAVWDLSVTGSHTYLVAAQSAAFVVHNVNPNAPECDKALLALTSVASVEAPTGEVFYRGMTRANYDLLTSTGKLPAGGKGETFITTRVAFSETYSAKSDEVLVQFTMKPGTLTALEGIGVRDQSSLLVGLYPNMPVVRRGWTGSAAYFKTEELNRIDDFNIGLGRGTALEVFNTNISSYKVVPR